MALTKKERTELGTRLQRIIKRTEKGIECYEEDSYPHTTLRGIRNSLISFRRDFHLEFKDKETKKKKRK